MQPFEENGLFPYAQGRLPFNLSGDISHQEHTTVKDMRSKTENDGTICCIGSLVPCRAMVPFLVPHSGVRYEPSWRRGVMVIMNRKKTMSNLINLCATAVC